VTHELTAQEILAIPVTRPERLFEGETGAAEQQYRRLAMKWHPDRNPGAGAAVFAHIHKLYENAVALLAAGKWRGPSVIEFKARDSVFAMHYRRAHDFELGTQYIGHDFVLYRLAEGYLDLAVEAQTRIEQLDFADGRMRKEHERYLPAAPQVYLAEDRSSYLTVKKSESLILLKDLIAHVGRLEAKHVAWILSSLYALNCYLDWTGVVHNAISEDTYFIDPADHSGALLGGWWYATPSGKRMKAAPNMTLAEVPDLRKRPIAARRTDSDLIRALGRRLIGGPSNCPEALWRWLAGGGRDSPVGEYHEWQHSVLPQSFGARRYVKLGISASDVYSHIT
jgi:hypothetical protein